MHAVAKDRFLIQFSSPLGQTSISDKASKDDKLTITTEQGNIFTFQAMIDDGFVSKEGMVQALISSSPSSLLKRSGRSGQNGEISELNDLLNVLRKSQHISICNNEDVEALDKYTGFSDVRLMPCALPDFDFDDIETSSTFLGKPFDWPLLITGMTGGLEQGAEINLRLAKAAARFNIPMGVGSQRIALENNRYEQIFSVKQSVPGVFLIGNIGMAQLKEPDPVATCQRAIDMISADALAIHLNVLQELIQVEGDRNFRGIARIISDIAAQVSVPVIIKEVGCGVDPTTARTLLGLGVAAIDCGGKGGTSWSYIEGLRAQSNITRNLGATFRDWGIPTAISTAILRQEFADVPLIATGGIRDGVTAACAIGLGASMCGIGLPLLRAAIKSEQAVIDTLDEISTGLRIAMAASGARTLFDLRSKVRVTEPFREQIRLFATPAGMNLQGSGVISRE